MGKDFGMLNLKFLAGKTVKTNYGKDYDKEFDEAGFCRVLSAALDSGRDDMDLFYAAKLAKGAWCQCTKAYNIAEKSKELFFCKKSSLQLWINDDIIKKDSKM